MLIKPQNNALVATIAAADRRLGKRYQWMNPARNGGIWHDSDDNATGKWLELPINSSQQAQFYETVEIANIYERSQARRELAYNPNYRNATLISGVAPL